MPPETSLTLVRPSNLPPHNDPSFSAQLAKQFRRIEELEFALQQCANWIDQGQPQYARAVALRAVKAPPQVI